MTEIEVLTKIANELSDIHFILALINIALWLILVCKRNYSYTDGIKDAIKELTSLIRSRQVKWE